MKNWGLHWRYDKEGVPHKVGIWFGGMPYSLKFYTPFLSKLWVK